MFQKYHYCVNYTTKLNDFLLDQSILIIPKHSELYPHIMQINKTNNMQIDDWNFTVQSQVLQQNSIPFT